MEDFLGAIASVVDSVPYAGWVVVGVAGACPMVRKLSDAIKARK